MIPDGPVLDALAREIDSALRGCRVRRVHQPDPLTLILRLWGPVGERRLLACADPAEVRVHLTQVDRPNPKIPFPFCMLARKHLEGRPFEEASVHPALPVITLRFGPRAPVGREDASPEHVRLVVEWTGHASTVALLAEREGVQRVLGLLRPLPRAQRDLSAGAPWTPPTRPGRLDPRTASAADLEETIARLTIHSSHRPASQRGSTRTDRVLSRAFEGVGRRTAAEALRRAGIDPEGPPSAMGGEAAARFLSALREILAAPCAPHAVLDEEGTPLEILPGPFPEPGLRLRPVPSISEALERVHARQGRMARLDARRAEVIRLIGRQCAHRETKLARQRGELEEARLGHRRRVLADLLLAQRNPNRRGETSIDVTDLHDSSLPRVTIPLDPALSLAENAARLYQRAKKSARAVGLLSRIIAQGEEEIRLIEDARVHALAAEEIGSLDRIALRLRESLGAHPRSPAKQGPRSSDKTSPAKQGPRAPDKAGAALQKPAAATGPRRFVVDGWEILAGRHSRDNDRIVTAWGRPEDLWFHARNVPGAHVLLRNPARMEPPASVVEAAARVAAYYSPAREEAGVDVIVAALRHVRKRKGLAAGQVEVTQGRTLRVRAGLPGPEVGAPGNGAGE